jgi:phage terminase large subunit-like protein
VLTQTALVNDLNWEWGDWMFPHEKKGDKKQNALVWARRQHAGRLGVMLGPWNKRFIAECNAFDGKGLVHDDQVDAVSGAAGLLFRDKGGEVGKKSKTEPGSIKYYRELAAESGYEPVDD